ncbi:hypothetical protein IG611_05365 [Pectobacterium sp. A535-S3-A17]|uniref:hypothetical protein n=1 Tax=Pectobacterium quasiaquaticum TaxID=2774015 RepID=UPI0018767A68|nr:hypothetical protein [Pectobacterium quasiaquaticum]MBE5214764.1 hypothetical protein [Pectobacterium quasiaquaticum]MBE5224803.1 hypothetical protein [Pectobacterium quasiaquaticum]
MRLELAKSLELKRDMTAVEADKLFTQGLVTSKHLFECPEPNCHAQVTCANLDRPKRLRKRDPYFKFVSEHTRGCRLEEQTDDEFRRVQHTKDDPEALPFIRDDVVELVLSAPNKRITHDLPSTEDNEGSIKRAKRMGINEDYENQQKRRSRKRLSGLADAFIAKENFFLETAEGRIHLRDFFIRVDDRKDLSEHPDEPRIYFGKAWINKKDDYYLVRFANEMRSGDVTCKPTFFIPARLVERSDYQRTSREALDKIAISNPSKPLYLFIFSELPPVKDNNANYINFKLDDLTYLYYRLWGKDKF